MAQSHRSVFVELAVNVAAPTSVLIFLSGDDRLGPVWSLVVALLFPMGHGLVTMITESRVSPIAVLALVSVSMTGGIGLLKLDARWFAWKEAAFPLLLGGLAVASVRTRWAALPTLLDPLLDSERMHALLRERGQEAAHEEALRLATWRLGMVFVLTALATFFFAEYMVTSPSGTEAFNAELGRYTGLALPVVGIPSTLLMLVVMRSVLIGIEERTGVEIDDLVR